MEYIVLLYMKFDEKRQIYEVCNVVGREIGVFIKVWVFFKFIFLSNLCIFLEIDKSWASASKLKKYSSSFKVIYLRHWTNSVELLQRKSQASTTGCMIEIKYDASAAWGPL